MKNQFNPRAPRLSKAEFAKQIFTEKLFKAFKEEFPEYKDMQWKDFKALWEDITETLREETVFNPLGVKLPFYLGELKTQYLPYKHKPKDRAASAKEDKPVNFLNILTRGKVAVIKWERRWAVKFNKMLQYYAFESNRKINASAKEHVLANPEKIRVSRNTLGGKQK